MSGTFRIGTRGSPLAVAQATAVRDALCGARGLETDAIEIVTIKTTGDMARDRPFYESGSKGIFTKEIEEALSDGRIDLAVHSAKDVQTALAEGLTLAASPLRADPRDAFVSVKAGSFAALPQGARLGTASVRRQALALRLRPDLEIGLLRGNVETRMDKMKAGACDATILAYAGLQRLGLTAHATELLDPSHYPPAVAQGIIAIEIRKNDERMSALVAAINHGETFAALTAERAFLKVLDGSCRTPIAGHATIEGEMLRFSGLVITPDGKNFAEVSREGKVSDAARIGEDAGRDLLARAPAGALAR